MEKLRILAIVAHCRDAFDMIGGTLANHAERGDETCVAVMCSTNYSDTLRLRDAIKKSGKINRAEAKHRIEEESEIHRCSIQKACKILGIGEIHFFTGKEELILFEYADMVKQAADIIQDFKPHILITHHPAENSGIGDHSYCGRAAMEAVVLGNYVRANNNIPHVTHNVFFFLHPGNTTLLDAMSVNRYPAIQIDVTSQVEKKLEALACIKVQYVNREKAAKELEALNGIAAIHSRISYMEAFQRHYPEVAQYLPVSERSLAMAKKSDEETLGKISLIAPYLPGVREAATDKIRKTEDTEC